MPQPDARPDVAARLVARGLVPGDATWRALPGGRTNRIWRVRGGGIDLVCKCYAGDGASPLFPNDPQAEALALKSLAGTGLAPRLHALDEEGGACLLYNFLPGDGAATPPEEVARLLRRLHDMPPPNGLRQLASGADAILETGDRALKDCPPDTAARLISLRPAPVDVSEGPSVFLHGDPVPANVVGGADGPALIDWQCPALGDPCEDLAIFLSPAMQVLYGGTPLDPAQSETVLAAYGDAKTTKRYRALALHFHWRMAAHCLWKAARGDADYARAAELEIAALRMCGKKVR
ncbi:MAG: phosphotransferase [Rhodobacteraceae bacterium]|nr:phosphotransferase [Paracoccaceae bacterium]